MTVTGDYYETLGVPRDADTETIKGAFHQLAHRYHPDVSTEPDAEQRFREIAEAYGVLSDPARRASYDQQGAAGLAGASAEDLWGGIDFTDIFGSRAPSFGTLFERLFGPAATGPQPGDDVHHDLTLSLEEVMTGADPLVTIRRPSPCPRCAGRGRVIDDPCPTCQGTGWATRTETVTIRIRPGIPEGATVKLPGQGMPSPMPGGPTGDAYLNIHTATDPLFRRVGADLWHDLHIQACDAALGVTTAVPLPGGQARIRVPPGTQPGNVLRVPGKGLPRYDEDGRGNLQLTVILDIPRQLESLSTPALRTTPGRRQPEHGGGIPEHGRRTRDCPSPPEDGSRPGPTGSHQHPVHRGVGAAAERRHRRSRRRCRLDQRPVSVPRRRPGVRPAYPGLDHDHRRCRGAAGGRGDLGWAPSVTGTMDQLGQTPARLGISSRVTSR